MQTHRSSERSRPRPHGPVGGDIGRPRRVVVTPDVVPAPARVPAPDPAPERVDEPSPPPHPAPTA